jgi:hypothetical protein
MFRPWNYSTDGVEAEERWPLQAAQLAAHALKPLTLFHFFMLEVVPMLLSVPFM